VCERERGREKKRNIKKYIFKCFSWCLELRRHVFLKLERVSNLQPSHIFYVLGPFTIVADLTFVPKRFMKVAGLPDGLFSNQKSQFLV
jgi:hypothetical protein